MLVVPVTASSSIAAGMLVTPSVRLERPLGAGGMGSVWLAEHLALGTKVVVKFISDPYVRDADARARFAREASAASRVKSPHVVQTFDHGVTGDGVPYIVMEHLEGQSLGDALAQHGVLAPPLVLEIVAQLSRALEKAHASGIWHRDIKPDNVFLCDAGDGAVFVKLLDFGIAKVLNAGVLSEGTKTGALMGSPLYMSPEQLMGSKSVDHRADLWAVGVVAYEALCGARPFEADTVGALTMLVHQDPRPKPSAVRPELPASFDDWFAKACAVKPGERFASPREMAEALFMVFTARPMTAPPPTPAPAARPSGAGALSRTLGNAETTLDATVNTRPKWMLPAIVVGTVALIGGVVSLVLPHGEQVERKTGIVQSVSAPPVGEVHTSVPKLDLVASARSSDPAPSPSLAPSVAVSSASVSGSSASARPGVPGGSATLDRGSGRKVPVAAAGASQVSPTATPTQRPPTPKSDEDDQLK